MKRITSFLVVFVLLCSGLLTVRATEWPQWRGPNRDGISDEVGLLKEWTKNGPKVLWKISLGEGFSGISVSQGRVYTMFSRGDDEFIVCLDATDGGEIWRFRSDKNYREGQGGNGPRATPTIDGDLLYHN